MSLKRRLVSAGMPVAGVFAAALALTGQPASAAPPVPADSALTSGVLTAGGLRLPVAVPAAATCAAGSVAGVPTGTCAPAAGYGTGSTRGQRGYPTTGPTTPGGGGNVGPTRGSGSYGGGTTGTPGPTQGPSTGPSATPSPTPGGGAQQVPSTGVPQPGGPQPGGPGPGTAPGGGFGVSPDEAPGETAGGALPVTGGPLMALAGIGGLLTAAGVGLRVYGSRRRRNS